MSETLNAQDIAKKLQEQLTSLSATVDTHEVSTVDEVGDGIARVSGLKSAMAGELLEFKSSDTGETVFGLAQNLDRDEVGAVLFGAVSGPKWDKVPYDVRPEAGLLRLDCAKARAAASAPSS